MKLRKTLSAMLCFVAVAIILSTKAGTYPAPIAEGSETIGLTLGAVTLLPAVLGVAMSFVTGNVVLSLLVGGFSGELLLAAINRYSVPHAFFRYCLALAETASDPENCKVLMLCIIVGGMVEVIRKTGGFECLARIISERIDTGKKACLISELLGIIIFFDDYANSLIIGPVLMPVTDRVRVSREKLAYIVDSTAAPVTGIAVISSWVAVETSIINEGLLAAGMPAKGYLLFLRSIPYCFYCLFSLIFVFMISLLGREYGPMLAAERRAQTGETVKGHKKVTRNEGVLEETRKNIRILIAIISVLSMVVSALVMFVVFGIDDTITYVYYSSMIGSLTALMLAAVFGIVSLKAGVQSWLKGGSDMFPTIVILVLAWALASYSEKLGTVHYILKLVSLNIPVFVVPLLFFIVCCIVSFAVGSFGCMFMVMPIAVPVALAISGIESLDIGNRFLQLCIASVICGGIFGDHCSPVTDCTILSSIGCGCETMDHVVTQMPYALTVAAISIVAITITSLGLPVFVSLLLGTIGITLVIWLAGKKP